MGSDGGARDDTARLSIDVDARFKERITQAATAARTTLRGFCVDALAEALSPTLQLCAPRTIEEAPLADFLVGAREVVLAGITLSRLHQNSVQQHMLGAIRDKVPMTFVTIDPESDNNDLVFRTLEQRYSDVFEGGLRGELGKTRAAIQELRNEAVAAGVPLQWLGTRQLPTCGLAIVDPDTPVCRMRVSFYLRAKPNQLNPWLQIDSREPMGMVHCLTFMSYYRTLSVGARIIELPCERRGG